jgi:hypothetical protein
VKMKLFKCDAPGCNQYYAVTEQPLSCPYCDSVALDDEPIKEFDIEEPTRHP